MRRSKFPETPNSEKPKDEKEGTVRGEKGGKGVTQANKIFT
jgi:hypothetical protein